MLKKKEKISEWMYQAYRKQTSENLSDEEALQLVFDRIEEAKIWIPDHEILNRYRAKKNQFRKRLAGENVPQHIYTMENILDEAGTFPDKLKRGVLSQDGIWNLLERNKELTQRLGISEVQGHDEHE